MVDSPRGAKLRARSVRARTTTGAVLVVGAALGIVTFALTSLMQNTMESSIKDAARLRAHDIVTQLEAGASPSSLALGADDDVAIQIVDEQGDVIASSPQLEGQPPLGDLEPGATTVVDRPALDDDPFVVAAEVAALPDGGVVVLAGRNLDLVVETMSVVTKVLVIGIPLLLLVVGITTWIVTGRALAPVESMRREVAEISASALHRRVPEPNNDDEIARLSRTMNHMLARLESARKRQQQLVSDAAHELRNPIAAIRNHAEIAMRHPDATDVVTLATEVLEENIRLQHVSEDLLLLARADENTLDLKSHPLDLDDVVLEEARRLVSSTDLRIDTSGVGAARTEGDRVSLQRVVRNLAENAVRHATSTVRFETSESNGHVILHVDDDGRGVPETARLSIFDRFTRLDEARDRERGGAGLGLAIVAEIVGAHGGTASVLDAPLGGARFEVILPSIQA